MRVIDRTKPFGAALLALILLLALFPCAAGAEDGNLLKNAGFEELDGSGLPRDWSTDEYNHAQGYTAYQVDSSVSHGGSRSVSVQNFGENDARFIQTVQVEPEELYRLSGWIRAEGISDFGWGANFSVLGVYASSEGKFDTDGEWVYVETYGETGPDQTEVTVSARLGGYSGESIGKAWFDDLSLEKVEGVPGTAVASLWFVRKNTARTVSEDDTEDAEAAGPFWPWLIAISAAWLLIGLAMMGRLRVDRTRELTEQKGFRLPAFFAAGLALSFFLRMAVALLVTGYEVDINCFLAWGGTVRTAGASGFYSATSFCDYPPAYVWVMGLQSLVTQGLSGLMPDVWTTRLSALVIKLVPSLCDTAMAWLLFAFARERKMNREQAGLLALLFAFNPLYVLNTAAWGQIDSVLALLLMLVAWLAIRRSWRALMPVYMLSVLVKPQALMLGPLGLLALILEWIGKGRTADENWKTRREMGIGAAIAAGVAALVVVPFGIRQPFGWLIRLYGNTLSSYAYATVNTANLYYLFNLNWVSIENASTIGVGVMLALIALGWGLLCWFRLKNTGAPKPWLEPALMFALAPAFLLIPILHGSWSLLGYLAMGLAFAVVLPLYIRSGNLAFLPLMGGLLFLLLYVLGIKMHERYIYPAIIFLFMAFAHRRDRRILLLMLIAAATAFVNEGIVLDNSVRLGASMGHLNNDTRPLACVLSGINLCAVLLALYTAADLCLDPGKETALTETVKPLLPIPTVREPALDPRKSLDRHRLGWKRLDTLLVAGVTLLYTALTLFNLGSARAPQTFWTSSSADEEIVIDLGEYHYNFSMAYYCGVSYRDFAVQVSDDGVTWSGDHWAEMNQGSCFHWKYLTPCRGDEENHTFVTATRYAQVMKLSGRYVKIRANQINLALGEVIFRESDTDENGAPVSAEEIEARFLSQSGGNPESPLYVSGELAVDEPGTLEGEPGWFNSTYFDEIYHARTAYEHYKGTSPYETTHPPLGKVLMSWCVAIFGMTPFGWRFAGALMGILMLPVMYLLGKQLTKRTDMAFAAMAMMALDCMHFTQTRIATIDSFPVLFIMCSYLFMLRFMQRDVSAAPIKTLLPDLGLSGFFMGCAVASKWIGVYAGLGLALLFFWTCARHLRLSGEAARILRESKKGAMKAEEESLLRQRQRNGFSRFLYLCLWCLLFFVAVPLGIYLLSYIPYFAYVRITSPGDYLKRVWDAQNYMLSYHSTPRMGMDHPFYSPWYEWPLIQRPMYYAMAYFMPEGRSQAIFCFGNPAVWLVGLAGLACCLWTWARRHRYQVPGSDWRLHAAGSSASIAPAFVLIGFLAQFLPWVLVPRGTYIYHYFASLPFLMLATTLGLYWLSERWPKAGRAVLIAYLAVCLACFVLFYPYASGIVTPVEWLDFGSKFLHLYHAS